MTAFNFHLFYGSAVLVLQGSVLFNLHTKFKPEAAGELLAVAVYKLTCGP